MSRFPVRILVMLDHCGFGDALRISFCLDLIRKGYPDARIVLLIDEAALAVIEHSRFVEKIVVSRLYTETRVSGLRLRLVKAKELMRLAFELGVGYDLVLTLGWGTTVLNVLGRLVGHRRIGYANAFPGLLSCRIGRYNHEKGPVEQNLKLLLEAGLRVSTAPTLNAIHSANDDRTAELLIQEHGVPPSSTLIIIHTGSDWACQQWVPERWAELADRLVCDYAATIVFTGTSDERDYIQSIQARMRNPSASLAGKTTLPQLGAILSRAAACVCTGTVVYELAQAANIPTIVLAGPTRVEFDLGLKGTRAPIMVNRTSRDTERAISRCQAAKAANRGCLNYGCPMSGLRDIQVADVLQAIENQGALVNTAVDGGRAK